MVLKSFRKAIPEIQTTTYGIFSIYKYPAKFIPQVVAYIIKNYCIQGMKVFDPFAGIGTVGFVSRIYNYDYELWDLNPLLNIIHDIAITQSPQTLDIKMLINEIKNCKEQFIPNWSNLSYWYPQEFLSTLYKFWGFIHSVEDKHIKHILLVPALKLTKFFSYADEKVHKLCKSKYSKQKVEKLLKEDWEKLFYTKLEQEIEALIKKKKEYERLGVRNVNYIVKGGVDSLEEELKDEVNILITSPPYLQAQEYIRSTKLELFWLGYDENYIKYLKQKEIPYRDVKETKIYSKKYYEYRNKIEEEQLRNLYQNYFNAILSAFTSFSDKVTDYMCIFVGRAKIRGIPIPIDEIIIEHLTELGWVHKITYIDKIVSRYMFKTKINPASKLEDARIKAEYLIILKKKHS